ncbi:MAG: amino acid kinase family protein [Candidatus Bathycorpusculaceae bacterium]
MEAVVKVGGSLVGHPAELKALCGALSSIAKVHKILIVPGGGAFADVVRRLDETYGLSDTTAHKMAILAMDQFGLFLSDITPNSSICYSLEDAINAGRGLLPILLPSRHIFREDPLEHSWNVTSDSVAAYITGALGAEKLVLITDVDGIYTDDPKKNIEARFVGEVKAEQLLIWGIRTSVDKALPKLLLKFKLDCYVVNGMYPERVQAIFAGEKSIYTRIIPF